MTKQENPNPDPTQLLKNNDQKYQNAIEIFCRAKKDVEICITFYF